MDLHDNITVLKGLGPKKAAVLKSDAGIETMEDLLYYIPRRYIDRSSFKQIRECFVNETVTVAGTISSISFTGRNKKRLEVVIDDGSDTLSGVFFGGFHYFTKIFKENEYVIFSGKINFYRYKQIIHPDFDFIDINSGRELINTGRIVPLYPSTENLKNSGFDSRGFRRIIKTALDETIETVQESISRSILDRMGLIGIREAIMGIHFPDSSDNAEMSRRRLAFNEIFFLQYYLALSRKYIRDHQIKPARTINEKTIDEFIATLPFTLTQDQVLSLNEIKKDILSPYPMNRLLQGDVGSGKTVVAMAASLVNARTGRQTALMAPTEVLAMQHYNNFLSFMKDRVSIELLTGTTPEQRKKEIYHSISSGTVDVIIGTHALIQEGVSFKDLGLIIIDEQHRFGVNQRAALRGKGTDTDLLIMTATPIPRSLTLTLYGDLDISSIKMKPSNRVPVKTLSFPASDLKRIYLSMEKYISQGRHIYYVLPLIEESEKVDLKSAMDVYAHLKDDIFKHRSVALLHGRMKGTEKESIMSDFKKGKIDILVSTTVIEVGIDVPEAGVIIIEHAERFGLAQLHQLRGRVGRDAHQSFCVLIYPDDVPPASLERLNILVSTDDGFRISEEDLKLRGAGEFIGSRQHGHAGDFEFTSLSDDYDLIVKAREEAEKTVSDIGDSSAVLEKIRGGKYDELIQGIRKKRILSILS